MPEDDLTGRALDVNYANLALGHRVSEERYGRFVVDERFPRIHDANHVTHVTASTAAEIDAIFARMDEVYALCPQRVVHTDFRTPPAVDAHLVREDWQQDAALVLLLRDELRVEAKPCDLRPLDGDADWAAFDGLHAADWREGHDPADMAVERDMARRHRLKSPQARYVLAHVDSGAVGYFNAWAGIDGMGQVESLFVLPEYRHRGIATALIHRCVADARAAGAGIVVIVAAANDTPKHMYAALGFAPVAVKRSWVKRLDASH